MIRRHALLAALVASTVLPAIALTGCVPDYAVDRAAAAARARQAAERAARAAMPTEYTDARHGVGYRVVDAACAGEQPYCRTVELYAYDTCDAIYVEADLLGRDGKTVGYLNGTTDAVALRGTSRMRLEWADEQAKRVRVTAADCRR